MKLSSKEKSRLRERYGRWALITGASSGIGRELAALLADAGFHLVLCARSQAGLQEVKLRLQAEHAVEIRTVPVDLSEEGALTAIRAATGDIEVGLLLLSAGFGTSGSFIDSSLEEERNLLRVNCEAVLVLTHHFSRTFAARKRGGIILLSSIVAFQGVPYSANYAASKAYVQSLAEALASELRPHGVDVLAAAPGPVASGFAQRAGLRMSKALTPAQVAAPMLRSLGRRTTVFPGWLSKLLTYSLRTVPRWGKVKIMAGVMRDMTKHHRTDDRADKVRQ